MPCCAPIQLRARDLSSSRADPSLKDYMAVEIAVSMKDLKMVKLLVEREQSGFGTTRTGDKSESPPRR